jgi:hypothetical protein
LSSVNSTVQSTFCHFVKFCHFYCERITINLNLKIYTLVEYDIVYVYSVEAGPRARWKQIFQNFKIDIFEVWENKSKTRLHVARATFEVFQFYNRYVCIPLISNWFIFRYINESTLSNKVYNFINWTKIKENSVVWEKNTSINNFNIRHITVNTLLAS